MTLTNYPDGKCCYGYMTLCTQCVATLPRRIKKYVDTSNPIKEYLPKVKCEECGCKDHGEKLNEYQSNNK
jgi:hypothetical protein